jgi:proline iminopeptidase
MRTRYPTPTPYDSGFLKVDDEHEIYYEQSGNPKGTPVVFLHGGPGAGTEPAHRGFFDPAHYRIVLLDQRGCGQSKPFASLNNNTTWHLVGDLEKLRSHLRIDQWLVFGGSWGSTLSLCYGIQHPERCLGLVLRGIFLTRPQEIKWFYQFGAHHLFPDQWDKYLEPIPVEERGDLVAAYYRQLTSEDETVRLRAAKAWSGWEGALLKLIYDQAQFDAFTTDERSVSIARIECHFFSNDSFLTTPNWILENIHRVKQIPAVIIHGRYDVVCPLENAWDLKKAWPEAQLEIIPDAGHAASEPGIIDALVRATDSFRDKQSFS